MKTTKKEDQFLQYPKEGLKEEFAKWLLAGIQEFPGGNFATSIFGTFFRPKIEGRREDFFNSLAEDIWQLKEKYIEFTPEKLKENDEFVNMTFDIIQSVLKTNNKNKINRLRNFLLNGVLDHSLKEDQKLQMLRILDWLSDVQFIILNQLYKKYNLNTIKDKEGNIYKGEYDSFSGTTAKSNANGLSFPVSLIDEQNLSFFPYPAILVLPHIADFINDENLIANLFGSLHYPNYLIEIANNTQELVNNYLIKVQLTEGFNDQNENDNIETENKVYSIYLTYIAERLMRFIQDPRLFDQK